MIHANSSRWCSQRYCHIVALATLMFVSASGASFGGIIPGTSGNLAFDFINGGAPSNNSISVELINVSGPMGSGLEMDFVQFDADFPLFEILLPVTFGTDIDFQFRLLSPFTVDNPNFDAFSFFVLDNSGTTSLLSSDEAGGSNALFLLDVDGTNFGALTVYSDTDLDPDTGWTVSGPDNDGYYSVHIDTGVAQNNVIPEPSSVLVWSLAAVGMGVFAHRRRKSMK